MLSWYELPGLGAVAGHGVFLGLAALLALLVWWSVRRAPVPAGPAVLRLAPYGVVLAPRTAPACCARSDGGCRAEP